MSRFFEYVDIFETTVLQGIAQKVVVDPVKIELLPPLPRRYVVSTLGPSTSVRGERTTVGQGVPLELARGKRYVVVTARTSDGDPHSAERMCEEEVDRAIAFLSVLLKPMVFGKRIYRGWVESERGFMFRAWQRFAQPVHLPVARLNEHLTAMAASLRADPETWRRFGLMSRFYTKAIVEDPGEERFLLLWTVLEVFPMKDTTNIKPISEYLGQVLGRPTAEVKEGLTIGRLYGLRSRLVHEGSLGIEGHELGAVVSKLEIICNEILRTVAGLPYRGTLDKYFEGDSSGT